MGICTSILPSLAGLGAIGGFTRRSGSRGRVHLAVYVPPGAGIPLAPAGGHQDDEDRQQDEGMETIAHGAEPPGAIISLR